MSDAFSDDDLRKALFVPCASKDDLRLWILVYLGLNIPDTVVDLDSTASPMDAIWEMYADALTGDLPEPKRLLAYGCRDGFKTLGAAIMEVLCIVHLGRSVAHMAAIETQAGKAQRYVKNFFAKRFLRDYVVTKNERRIEFVHYLNEKTGDHISHEQWEALPEIVRDEHVKLENYIQIIICTMSGTNSEHVPFMVVDEVDVVENPKAYEEAKFIPAPYEGKMPLTMLVSTRKTSFGLVQKEIDDAEKTGLTVRHWNIIDVTEACPTSRHRPDDPRVTLYRSDDELRHLNETEFEELEPAVQAKFTKHEGAYAGCAKCPLFSTCKGRLATEQKSKSSLLKPIPHVIHEFKISSLENAQAQLMSRKPASTGLIYPRFSQEVHMLDAVEIAKRIVGEDMAPKQIDKDGLILLMIAAGAQFFSGLDWGFTHRFAIVSGAVWGNCIYIFDVISQSGLDPEEKLTVAERIKAWNPTIFADPEAPDQIKLFKKKQFQMRDWKKGPGSVPMGIDVCRMKMRPAAGPPQFFILRDDPGCLLLAERLSKYHFELDQQGMPTERPSEDNDDECDATRYLVLNLFAPKGRVTTTNEAPEDKMAPTAPNPDAPPTVDNYVQHFINQHVGEGLVGGNPAEKRGRKGRIIWSMD
jgi:hypothetical protein